MLFIVVNALSYTKLVVRHASRTYTMQIFELNITEGRPFGYLCV